MPKKNPITLKKVSVHNLKGVDVEIQQGDLVVCTGVSGSGKSSLAFDTIYTEGQRRYVESLSNFAKRQLGDLPKPELEKAEGISPTISIEQKTAGRNPRSLVATMTEIHDFLRVLYARLGTHYCPVSKERVMPQSKEKILKSVEALELGKSLLILAPFAKQKKGLFVEEFEELLKRGFTRLRIDQEMTRIEETPTLDAAAPHDIEIVIDRIKNLPENRSRLAEAIFRALDIGKGALYIVIEEDEKELFFSTTAFSKKSGLSYPSLEPHDFSFNSHAGMCTHCHGLGTTHEFDLDLVIDPKKSIAQDCCSVATSYQTVRYQNIYNNLASLFNFSLKTPWKKLSKEAQKLFLFGTEDSRPLKMHFVHPTKGYSWVDRIRWKGVLWEARERFQQAKSASYQKKMAALMVKQRCPTCEGTRLKPYPSMSRFWDKALHEILEMSIEEALHFFEKGRLNTNEKKIGEELIKEIIFRLKFLNQVGVGYLTLDRTAPTLSGGEAQRVRLASQIGSGLVGITYVLDEPSIGLHPEDNQKLIEMLKALRDQGNTLVVVEHDEETILAADHVLDFGPGAGSQGGKLLVNGPLKSLLKSKDSLTGKFLTFKEEISVPKRRPPPSKKEWIHIKEATHHNLQKVSVEIPLKRMVVVTGLSGSGKSSLITDTLYPALSNELHQSELEVGPHKTINGKQQLDKVICIDQSPIGRNPRSNPSTYIKLFDEIRDLFAAVPESVARGYPKGRFSFNVGEGSCATCGGMGEIKVDMDFMEAAYTSCPECHGKRFDLDTLLIKYKGKSIYDILEMDVDRAYDHFENIPSIRKKLQLLRDVGLGYLKLGQSSTTLSGGEAQRIKLARELARPATGRTLYILDEPTTGLHYQDIRHLLAVLQKLVDRGNTILIIEHNIDVIKCADWILDLGPGGGKHGGKIIGNGTPEEIAKQKTPTGKAISHALKKETLKAVKKILKSKGARKKRERNEIDTIEIQGAEEHNLKHLDISIPRGKITVCTGPSGSGKSSFAFDTLYAEGQRRYAESLSPYVRQFIKSMPKPKVGQVDGLSPAIAIDQKGHMVNPRSTVGTLTEIYDFLRILYATIGIPHCPETKETIKAISKQSVVERLLSEKEGSTIYILAPLEYKNANQLRDLLNQKKGQGFLRVRIDKVLYELEQLDEIPIHPKKKQKVEIVIDRLKLSPNHFARLMESVEEASVLGKKKLLVIINDEERFFNLSFSVESTGRSYPEITPHTFSFNTKEGMCPYCEGIGVQHSTDLSQFSDIQKLTISDLLDELWMGMKNRAQTKLTSALFKALDLPLNKKLSALSNTQLNLFLNGSKGPLRLKGLPYHIQWRGLNHVLTHALRNKNHRLRRAVIQLMSETTCLFCEGARVNDLARHVTVKNKPLHALTRMPISELVQFIEKLKLTKEQEKILHEVMDQLKKRLAFLLDVGLEYLSLDRTAPTLSGGEAQRIRLARQLGSGLTGTLYVLDEPTIGLHPSDNEKLLGALKKLNDLGNTLVLVEHDFQTLQIADTLLDFGPTGGAKGGHLVARGTLNQLAKDKNSLTGQYLSKKLQIEPPKKQRPIDQKGLQVKHAQAHNLKNFSLTLPKGALTFITGVSGSGKSSLTEEILIPAVQKGLMTGEDKVILPAGTVSGIDRFNQLSVIDQSPLGQTVRSNVGTYVGALDRLRELFASLNAAKALGLEPKHFSYNHKKGMCTHCFGLGFKWVDMQFMPPVRVPCEACDQNRLNPISLSVTYHDKNFGEYLKLTVDEARQAFDAFPRITRVLDSLIDVGLGYLSLGQETATLSGGEAQRIKLSRELSKRGTKETLYIMDEPTTGLHIDDIAKLLKILHRLVDKGATIVVIEHHSEMIRSGDYVIDLGPGAGSFGGNLLYEGRPQDLTKIKGNATGKYLSTDH